MSQQELLPFIQAARTYRRYVVNPTIKGMLQAFWDMGVYNECGVYFGAGSAQAEQVWHASAL